MMDLLKRLKDLDVYICVVLLIVANILKKYGYVDPETFSTIALVLGGLAVASMKMVQSKTHNAVAETREHAKKAFEHMRGMRDIKECKCGEEK